MNAKNWKHNFVSFLTKRSIFVTCAVLTLTVFLLLPLFQMGTNIQASPNPPHEVYELQKEISVLITKKEIAGTKEGFPYGLSYKSRTSKVEFTPRLKRLFFVYLLFITFVTVLLLTAGFGFFGSLISFLFSFFFFDRSLGLMMNIEKSLSMKYVDTAAQKLDHFNGPIIAITGSFSKTTTKEVLGSILSTNNKVFITPGSFNNRLGIAKAINNEDISQNDLAIIEMGTYGVGEIKEICSWVKPHIAVITGIGPVHLERMKNYETILDAKSEIVELAGSVVINGDDEMLINRARTWINSKQVVDCSIETNKALSMQS